MRSFFLLVLLFGWFLLSGGNVFSQLVISEFMASNESTLQDEDGDYSDWIELYNPTDQAVDLTGWSLTDDADDLRQWIFPELTMASGEFLLVFASGKDRRVADGELHCNFKLSRDGEYLGLADASGVVVADFGDSYPEQASDVSYGSIFSSYSLFAPGETARYHVPQETDANLDWTQTDFDDSGWASGPSGFGFVSTESDFQVNCYWLSTGEQLQSLAAAEDLVADTSKQGWTPQGTSPVVNFLSTGDSGHFDEDSPFPGMSIGTEIWNVAVEVTGSITISEPGEWTFGVNSDDGFALELTRAGQTFDCSYSGTRSAEDTLETFTLPEAGSYQLRLLYFQWGWGGTLELFAAKGRYSEFDADAFALVGAERLAATNLESVLKGNNASLWTRFAFDCDNPADLASLWLQMNYEDGFVAYLNGQEVARRNAPEVLAWNSTAASDRALDSASTPEKIDLSTALSLLRTGENVLAVHVLNDSADDANLLIRPELYGIGDIQEDASSSFLSVATPGQANDSVAATLADTVSFSRSAGVFNEPFALSLSTESDEVQIRYTQDGSVPTWDSTLYETALTISANSEIRARAFRTGYLPGPTRTQAYLALAEEIQGFSSNLPIVIINNQASALSADEHLPVYSFFIDTDSETGRAELAGALDFAGRATMKMRGWSSYNLFPKKQYSFKVRDEQGDKSNASILGMPSESEWILFAPYSDKTLMRNQLMYKWSNDMGRYAVRTRFVEVYLNQGGDTIDGDDYLGVYIFMERISRDSDRVDIDKLEPEHDSEPEISGGYLLKQDHVSSEDPGFYTDGGTKLYYIDPDGDEVTAQQETYIQTYINEMEAALNAEDYINPQTGKSYEDYIDVDSFIDHHILVELSRNVDGIRLSTYMYKPRGGKLNMGPIWDYNLALGNANYYYGDDPSGWYADMIEAFTDHAWYNWYERLFTNPDFQQRWIDRWTELREGVLATKCLMSDIDASAELLAEAAERNLERWPVLGTYIWPNPAGYEDRTTYASEVDWMKTWIQERLAWLDGQLVQKPTLTPAGGVFLESASVALSGREGIIYYTLDGTDPRESGGAVSTSAMSFSVGTESILAEWGSQWAYWDEGTLPAEDWFAEDYDDLAWLSGDAMLGYDTSDGDAEFATVVDYGDDADNKHLTTYFRHVFSVSDVSGITSLILQLQRDDGAVVYLNGQEVARSNMPTGAVSNATLASSSMYGDAETAINKFWLDPALLTDGINVLAAEVHQIKADSSDLRFDLQLSAFAANPDDFLHFDSSAQLKARVLADGEWSAMSEADFVIGESPSLVVTELHYNPYAVSDEESAAGFVSVQDFEFVELTNTGDETISLANVAFVDGISFSFADSAVTELAAGQRLVVVSNRVAFEARYGQEILVAGEYVGSLNDGGETIALAYDLGTVFLEFSYSDSGDWPGRADGKGFSLELLDVNASCDDAENWRSSFEFGGSPGWEGSAAASGIVINEVLTHTDLPQMDAIELHNPTSQPVDIGGWVLGDSTQDYCKYRIPADTMISPGGYLVFDEEDFNASGLDTDTQNDNPADFALDGAHGDSVWLLETDASGNVTRYVDHVTFSAAANGESFGRWPDGSGSLWPMSEVTLGQTNAGPRVGPVIISEIMVDPGEMSDAKDLEYVELCNPTDAAVDLSAWRLRKGIDFEFEQGATLSAGGTCLILSFNPDKAGNEARVARFRLFYGLDQTVALFGGYEGWLDNSGDRIQLQRPDEPPVDEPDFTPYLIVDEVEYGSGESWPEASGQSLVRLSADAFGNDAASWQVGTDGGTPGQGLDATLKVANPLDDLSLEEDAPELFLSLTGVFAKADCEESQISKTVFANSNPELVTATIEGDFLAIRLGANQYGNATITICADAGEGTSFDQFDLQVDSRNDIPVANDAYYYYGSVSELVGQLTASDADGDPLQFVVATFPQHGLVELDPDTGDFTYEGDGDMLEEVSFTFTASDGTDVSAPATVTIHPAEIELVLSPGWNLLSLPFDRDGAPEEILSLDGVTGVCGPVWAWDAANERYQAVENGFLARQGFWVFCLDSMHVQVSGCLNGEAVFEVLHGWNLTGPAVDNVPVAESDVVWEWGLEKGYRRPAEMNRGIGYWIYQD
jgi:hypothetical protein